MNKVTTDWVLTSSDGLFFKTITTEYKIVDVKYLRPRTWRFYSAPNTYVLAILSDSVRIQSDPDFVVRFPETINDFLKSNGMIIR